MENIITNAQYMILYVDDDTPQQQIKPPLPNKIIRHSVHPWFNHICLISAVNILFANLFLDLYHFFLLSYHDQPVCYSLYNVQWYFWNTFMLYCFTVYYQLHNYECSQPQIIFYKDHNCGFSSWTPQYRKASIKRPGAYLIFELLDRALILAGAYSIMDEK